MARDDDAELTAIQSVIAALQPLDEEARSRVLDYVFSRLAITVHSTRQDAPASHMPAGVTPVPVPPTGQVSPPKAKDVRTLKEEKQPRSANQMAALVAYYLADLVPADERKEAIATQDITKYFKQASFPLPENPRATLANAANAGYFDHAGGGLYKLNPVGHNLVVHGMPTKAPQKSVVTRRQKKARRKSRGRK